MLAVVFVLLGATAVGAAVLGPEELSRRWDALTGVRGPGPTAPVSPTVVVEQDSEPVEAPEPTRTETAEPDVESSSPSPDDEGDFSSLYAEVRTGVVKVRATTCDGTGVGSGFLVDDRTIVTAAHVVAQAASVVVNQGAHRAEATVTGVHEAYDLAVLELAEPLSGHEFELASESSLPGESVAVIGHPLGDPLTITRGVVSRTGSRLWPDVQIDAAVNPGSSGGPVITEDGSVVGVVVAKDRIADSAGYALRMDVAAPLIETPSSLAAPEPAFCDQPVGPDVDELPDVTGATSLERAAARTLANYFAGINSADYALAYDQLSPRLQSGSSLDSFAEGVSTSYDYDFDVRGVQRTPDGLRIWLEFVSMQAPRMGPDGEGCTEWSLDYELVWFGDRLLIHRVSGHDASEGHEPCN